MLLCYMFEQIKFLFLIISISRRGQFYYKHVLTYSNPYAPLYAQKYAFRNFNFRFLCIISQNRFVRRPYAIIHARQKHGHVEITEYVHRFWGWLQIPWMKYFTEPIRYFKPRYLFRRKPWSRVMEFCKKIYDKTSIISS